jgi:hypothetical protein
LIRVLVFVFLATGTSIVNAEDPTLYNWGFNLDGAIWCLYPEDTEFCDYGPGDLPPNIDTTGFNFNTGVATILVIFGMMKTALLMAHLKRGNHGKSMNQVVVEINVQLET